MEFVQLGGRSIVMVSLKTRVDSSVAGRIITGSFELVKSDKVSETPSGEPLDVCCKCQRVGQVKDKIRSQSLTHLDSRKRSPT